MKQEARALERVLLGLAGLMIVAVLNYGAAPAMGGHIVTNGCSGFGKDSSRWLSVMRGPDLSPNGQDIYQYWLSQRYVYATDSQAQYFSGSVWPLPPGLVPIDGLVLGFYQELVDEPRVLRVLLQDAKNCFYDVLIPQFTPADTVIQRTFCPSTVFHKIVPDSNVDMRDVRNLVLVSFDKIVVLAVDTLQEMAFAKIPDGDMNVTSLVDASYQRNHGYDDQLFVVRGANTTGGQLTSSEIVNFRVNVTQQAMTLTFGHFKYLQGESDTMFVNDDSTHLFWTRVMMNQDSGVKQGVLYDYGLQSPHSFRFGAMPFSSQSSARWGAHSFSSFSKVNAMMITSTDSFPGQVGYTIQAVYLNESLSSLRFIDPLMVNTTVLPSLGQSVGLTAQTVDFAVVMASQNMAGNLCLQLFMHCASGSDTDCGS